MKLSLIHNKSLIIVIILVTIFTTDSLLWGTNKNVMFQKIPQAVLGIMALIGPILTMSNNQADLRQIIILNILLSCIVLTSLCNFDFRAGYIYKMILLVFGFWVANSFTIIKFAKYYNKVIFLISCVSLVCFVISVIYENIFSLAPCVYNLSGDRFRNLFLYVQNISGYAPRNYGLYREPGCYQIFLIVALLFETYMCERTSILRVSIFSLTLFTTLSSAGILAFIVWLMLHMKHNIASHTSRQQIKLWIICFIISLIILMALFLDILPFYWKIFGKFTLTNPSFLARWGSIVINLQIWLENFITGSGLSNIDLLFLNKSIEIFGTIIRDNTNTILAQFAVYGTLYGIFALVGYFRGAWLLGQSFTEKILIIMIIIILSISQNLSFSPLGNVLMMYGLIYKMHGQKYNCIKY